MIASKKVGAALSLIAKVPTGYCRPMSIGMDDASLASRNAQIKRLFFYESGCADWQFSSCHDGLREVAFDPPKRCRDTEKYIEIILYG